MKKVFVAILLLTFSTNFSTAQDQVKIKESAYLLEGKIVKVTNNEIQLISTTGINKKMAITSVDSVYTKNDTVLDLCFKVPYLRKRVTTYRMSSRELNPEFVHSEQKDTLFTVIPAKSNSHILKKTSIYKAGKAFVSSGTFFSVGISTVVVGGVLAANGSPNSGLAFVGVGGVLNILAYVNLIRGGVYLIKTEAISAEIGLLDQGIGFRAKF